MAFNWKGLFVQQDESEETTPAATATLTTTARTPAVAVSVGGDPSVFEGQLREAVTERATEYVKFKNACDELKSVLPDEGTRLKSAFVSMKAMGITKATLISTAKDCLGTLASERSQFESAMANASATQVEGEIKRLTSLDKQIEDKLAQAASIQAEVDAMRLEKSKITSGVEASRSKIESAKRDFEAAFNRVNNEISSDISRIESSL